jgi:hypothetical protein
MPRLAQDRRLAAPAVDKRGSVNEEVAPPCALGKRTVDNAARRDIAIQTVRFAPMNSWAAMDHDPAPDLH